MNRGFKTEEQIELSLNPKLHYELIGSNNPDATLTGPKLAIPRIGSADDCSVLLQADNGPFTHADIVNCLSKESKGTITTKLEDVPLTAQQRVGMVGFFTVFIVLCALLFYGLDAILSLTAAGDSATRIGATDPAAEVKPDLQGWTVRDVYSDEPLYTAIISKRLKISVGRVTTENRIVSFPVSVTNSTESVVSYTLQTNSAVSDEHIDFSSRVISNRLLFPGGTASHVLSAAVSDLPAEQKAILVLFLSNEDGGTLRATRLVSAE